MYCGGRRKRSWRDLHGALPGSTLINPKCHVQLSKAESFVFLTFISLAHPSVLKSKKGVVVVDESLGVR